MARGFVSGVVWGLAITGIGGTTASLLDQGGGRVVLAPPAESVAAVTKAPVPRPQTQAAAPVVETPQAQTPAAEVEPTADDTPAENPVQATASDPVIEDPQTAKVQEPVIPEVEETPPVVAPTEDAQPEEVSEAPVEVPTPAEVPVPTPDMQPVTPPAPEMVEVPVVPDVIETPTPEMAQPVLPAEPSPPKVIEPRVAPVMPPVETPAAGEPVPETEMPQDAAVLPETTEVETPRPAEPAVQPQEAALPKILRPAPVPQEETAPTESATENTAPSPQIRHLPTIGGNPEPDTQTEQATEETGADKGALETYAVPFENPDAKPILSVVLIDDPDYPVEQAVLDHLPFPLAFAIDAARDDAEEIATRYRDAGFEVLLLTNLPQGASASDTAVTFEAYSTAVPQAVAVLDRGANSMVAKQIAGILADRGFGLVTPSKGLNSAQKAARREGVPAALIYRELDGDGETVPVMRRYLDRAAFRAAQEGSVIMLGHTRPETIEALVLWALEDRAASVAIAPVSAVLKGG